MGEDWEWGFLSKEGIRFGFCFQHLFTFGRVLARRCAGFIDGSVS